MKFSANWMNAGLDKAFESLTAKVQAPVTIELWDGREFPLGPEPKVKMQIRKADALKHLLSPTLGTLAEAYVEGDVEVEGSMTDVIAAADQLSTSAGTGVWDKVTSLAASRHTRKVDR